MGSMYTALFGWLTAKPSIHTLIGAAGSIAYGVYQLSQGSWEVGVPAITGGWVALGIGTHHAVGKQPEVATATTPVAEVPAK